MLGVKGWPLLTPQVMGRFAKEFEYVRANASKFKHPCCMLLGLKDKIVCNETAREVFKLVGSEVKESAEFADGHH